MTPKTSITVPYMDLSAGFEIENPAVFVPWGICEDELRDLLPTEAHHVTDGYYVIDCSSLSGLDHALGFHFRPQHEGKLRELEFFRRVYPDTRASFEEFQEHLVSTFGPPGTAAEGEAGLPNYTWRIGVAWIRHYVMYRFGNEEYVRITRS
jgi:hypothetical protein